jgi:predicted nucleic acid-binding Zn ribbon protein
MIRQLKCSFCGRSEQLVKKLVAGPRVFICDECANSVIRIMNDDAGAATPRPERRGLLQRIGRLLGRRGRSEYATGYFGF